MNINTDAVVINQCSIEQENNFIFNGKNIKWVDSLEKGLSKSRNMALKYASGDICLIADDDLEYVDLYEKKLLRLSANILMLIL